MKVKAVGGIMCQVNEKTTEIKECKCKEICCKMQRKSLRSAIRGLKIYQYNSNTVKRTLEAIYNLLEVYSCLPGTCLLERVKWVNDNITGGNGRLYRSEEIKVDMLIEELEAFLDNSY